MQVGNAGGFHGGEHQFIGFVFPVQSFEQTGLDRHNAEIIHATQRRIDGRIDPPQRFLVIHLVLQAPVGRGFQAWRIEAHGAAELRADAVQGGGYQVYLHGKGDTPAFPLQGNFHGVICLPGEIVLEPLPAFFHVFLLPGAHTHHIPVFVVKIAAPAGGVLAENEGTGIGVERYKEPVFAGR